MAAGSLKRQEKKKEFLSRFARVLFLLLPPFRRSCRLGGPVSGTADPCYFLLDPSQKAYPENGNAPIAIKAELGAAAVFFRSA